MSDDPYADPAAYWADRGQALVESTKAELDHAKQEYALLEVLRHLEPPPIKTIFEAGCGGGRIALFFKMHFPDATYAAIDVGDVQLAATKAIRPNADLQKGDLTNPRLITGLGYYDDHAFPGFDLVVSSEVLMHIRPQDLSTAFSNLLNLVRPGGHLVLVEWVPLKGELEAKPTAYWNFPHNYRRLVSQASAELVSTVRIGRQKIMVVKA